MYVLGIDVGTTGTKALLIAPDGTVTSSGYAAYPLITEGVCSEQRSEAWIEAVCAAVRGAVGERESHCICALSVSTQGASMTPVDEAFRPLSRAITWLDRRSTEESDWLEQALGNDYLYRVTGWRASPSLDAAKILHLKRRGSTAHAFFTTLEIINQFLTGEPLIDPTNAGIRQLYDYSAGCWDQRILNLIGCDEHELPEVRATGDLLGTLTAHAATALGLPRDTRVYQGAHDQYCASLGSGAVEQGDMLLSTGTTWAVMGISTQPLRTSAFIASCTHPISGRYGNLVSLLGAGVSYQWLRDQVVGEDFGLLEQGMAKKTLEKDVPFFIPWLCGAGYPHWKPQARGGFLGLDATTDRYDLAASVQEAAVFGVRRALDDFAAHGCAAKRLVVMGGATRSGLWMRRLAAALSCPVTVLNMTDIAAYGAAAIARLGEGMSRGYGHPVGVGERLVEPEPALAQRERRRYSAYCETIDAIARLEEKQHDSLL